LAVLALPVGRPADARPTVALRASARHALDAMLECERPEGGWTYVCPPRGPYGAVTWPLVRALAIARPLGLADWDVAVLRSPGTPAAGLALVEGYRRSGDPRYLAAARRTGDLLLALQLSSGGWFSEVPVHGARPARWFTAIAHWDTLDDDVTPGAIRMLLTLAQLTGDRSYHEAASRGIDVPVGAQRRRAAGRSPRGRLASPAPPHRTSVAPTTPPPRRRSGRRWPALTCSAGLSCWRRPIGAVSGSCRCRVKSRKPAGRSSTTRTGTPPGRRRGRCARVVGDPRDGGRCSLAKATGDAAFARRQTGAPLAGRVGHPSAAGRATTLSARTRRSTSGPMVARW
jgi:hypothetical protein